MNDVRERIDDILSAQNGRVLSIALTDADYFLVVGLYLSPDDLEAIHPFLQDENDQPRLGTGLRYNRVPVFQVADRPSQRSCYAEYRGIWFQYVPWDVVD